MPTIYRTAASLRFHGDDLDPEEISQALSAQPTHCVKKGGIWTRPKGREVVARTGGWTLKAPDENPGNLDKQIASLLSPLSDDFPAWRALANRFRGNIFVGLFLSTHNEGLSVSPEIAAAIGARGLGLDLDIYSGADEDQEIG